MRSIVEILRDMIAHGVDCKYHEPEYGPCEQCHALHDLHAEARQAIAATTIHEPEWSAQYHEEGRWKTYTYVRKNETIMREVFASLLTLPARLTCGNACRLVRITHTESVEVIDQQDGTARVPTPADPIMQAFEADLQRIELPAESVAIWIKHRADLATLAWADKETAWKAICDRTEFVGRLKNAKIWLKRAIAEEDARRSTNEQLAAGQDDGVTS